MPDALCRASLFLSNFSKDQNTRIDLRSFKTGKYRLNLLPNTVLEACINELSLQSRYRDRSLTFAPVTSHHLQHSNTGIDTTM